MTTAVDTIHEGFLFRLYGYTLSKLVDGNFVGLDLFYKDQRLLEGAATTPSDLLFRPTPQGLSYKIGEWSFDYMSATADIGQSDKPYYLQFGPEDLLLFVDEFVNALIRAGASSESPLIVECSSILEKVNQLFDDGWGDGGEGGLLLAV